MSKVAIVYKSVHHGNTQKLVNAIAAKHEVTLIEAPTDADLSAYDAIGFASGVYMGKLHKTLYPVLERLDGAGKRAFAIYTCASADGAKYADAFAEKLRARGFAFAGSYFCLGWDSFGPLRLIGGILKDKPDAAGIAGAVRFFEEHVAEA